MNNEIERLKAIQYEILLSLDNVLLLCGYYMRNGIRDEIVKDTIDDLLDTRSVLTDIKEDLNGLR